MLAPLAFPAEHRRLELRFSGVSAKVGTNRLQTLLCASRPDEMPPLWIGLRGERQQLTAIIHHAAGRSPHYWLGPCVRPGAEFDLRLQLHWDMGPGGILYWTPEDAAWTSMSAASPWGLERLQPCSEWHVGRSYGGENDQPFDGALLAASVAW